MLMLQASSYSGRPTRARAHAAARTSWQQRRSRAKIHEERILAAETWSFFSTGGDPIDQGTHVKHRGQNL
jgi:hypothetical protein